MSERKKIIAVISAGEPSVAEAGLANDLNPGTHSKPQTP